MTESEIQGLRERLRAMSDDDRRALDPICAALWHCWKRERPEIMCLPNRVVALACLELAKRFSESVLRQE